MPWENPVRMKGTMMAFKNTCTTLAKVGEDEPIFVLRAQDPLAPYCIRQWVTSAAMRGVDKAKLKEAMDCADAMDKWTNQKLPD